MLNDNGWPAITGWPAPVLAPLRAREDGLGNSGNGALAFHLPVSGISSRNAVTTYILCGFQRFSSRNKSENVTAGKSSIWRFCAGCDGVTAGKGESGAKTLFSGQNYPCHWPTSRVVARSRRNPT